MSNNELVHYAIEADIARITMDDGKANALSYEMIEGLLSAFDRAEAEAKAVILTGRAGRFCAGFDLKVMLQSMDSAVALLTEGAPLFLRLLRFPRPVIAVSTGHAIAGGALLLLASDIAVGVDGPFKIGLNEVSIGLPLPIMAVELARAKLDSTRLSEATLAGQVYTPQEAAKVGYLNHAVPAESLTEFAANIARGAARIDGRPFAATKKRLWGQLANTIESSLSADLKAFTVPAE